MENKYTNVYDITAIEIDSVCYESYPCKHHLTVTINETEHFFSWVSASVLLRLLVVTKSNSSFLNHFNKYLDPTRPISKWINDEHKNPIILKNEEDVLTIVYPVSIELPNFNQQL